MADRVLKAAVRARLADAQSKGARAQADLNRELTKVVAIVVENAIPVVLGVLLPGVAAAGEGKKAADAMRLMSKYL